MNKQYKKAPISMNLLNQNEQNQFTQRPEPRNAKITKNLFHEHKELKTSGNGTYEQGYYTMNPKKPL